jgi:mannonate dehydratase
MLGLPGRDEQIENVIVTIRNLGRAGIPILGFHWMPASVWRTAVAQRGRGGAVVSAFDLRQAEDWPERVDGGVLAGVALPAPTSADT